MADLNAKIVQVNRTTFDGPPSNMYPLDVEEAVLTWREHRVAIAAAMPEVPTEPDRRLIGAAFAWPVALAQPLTAAAAAFAVMPAR